MKLHEFIPRETLNNAKLSVCKNCGAVKNHLNENSICKERKEMNIEKFLKPVIKFPLNGI